MTKSRIPEDVKQHRPGPCTEIKHINGHYYVYMYSARHLPNGNWGRKIGKCIGKIVEGTGFIPNKNFSLYRNVGDIIPDEDVITVLEYGQYALVHTLAQDILTCLKRHFPADRAALIFSYAVILYVNDFVHLDQIHVYYEQCWLNLEYGKLSLKLGRTALGKFLDNLGRRTARVVRYEQSMIKSSSARMAIDGHAVGACSGKNDLAEAGGKFHALKENQVNLLMGYDIVTGMPLFARMYRGTCSDKSTIEDLNSLFSFREILFVVDRGFYSEDNLEILSVNDNTYIIPVPASTGLFKEAMKDVSYSASFYYRAASKHSRIEYQTKLLKNGRGENVTIYVFRDIDENEKCRYNYLHCLELGRDGYTQEQFEEGKEFFGVYVLRTNGRQGPEETFASYKKRWGIETFYQYLANVGDYNDLMMQDYYKEQGLAFVMLVAGQIHQKIVSAVKKLGCSTISTRDILLMARRMKIEKRGNFWLLKNTRKKDLELFGKLNFTPSSSIPAN